MTRGVFTAFTLTGDGAGMVMDEGTFDHSVWAVPLSDAMKGALADERRVAHASTLVGAAISPSGSTLLVRRTVPTTAGHAEVRYSLMPFEGGAETPLPVAGAIRRAVWSDSQHVATWTTLANGGVRLSEVDVRTGTQRNGFEIPDSTITDFAALPNGWAWIPAKRDRIVVTESGRRREYRPLPWFGVARSLAADRAGHRVFYGGFGGPTSDSSGVGAITLDDGKQALWATRFAEDARLAPGGTHAVILAVAETQDSWALYGLDGPGQMTALGTIGRPIVGITVSADLSRATVMVRDYRADAWLNKVVVR
jgi:hypothetical protein